MPPRARLSLYREVVRRDETIPSRSISLEVQKVSSPTGRIVVAIATPIEQRLIAGIAAVDDRLDVRYEPRGAGNEARWKQLLADAEIVFGIPGDALPELTHLVRTSAELRWVQMAESNTYEQLREAGLSAEDLDRMP